MSRQAIDHFNKLRAGVLLLYTVVCVVMCLLKFHFDTFNFVIAIHVSS